MLTTPSVYRGSARSRARSHRGRTGHPRPASVYLAEVSPAHMPVLVAAVAVAAWLGSSAPELDFATVQS